jgi:calcineurin-like phosphoesterase family protein
MAPGSRSGRGHRRDGGKPGRLHGNICLIRGNHDKTADRMKESFSWVKDYYELKVEDADAPSGK